MCRDVRSHAACCDASRIIFAVRLYVHLTTHGTCPSIRSFLFLSRRKALWVLGLQGVDPHNEVQLPTPSILQHFQTMHLIFSNFPFLSLTVFSILHFLPHKHLHTHLHLPCPANVARFPPPPAIADASTVSGCEPKVRNDPR